MRGQGSDEKKDETAEAAIVAPDQDTLAALEAWDKKYLKDDSEKQKNAKDAIQKWEKKMKESST